MSVRTRLIVLAMLPALCALVPGTVRAAESYDNCTGYIDSLPATITTQGTWCLRKDLATAIDSGSAIFVSTNNVIIDCNDFKVGGLAAGPYSQARGIVALDRRNITIRNCNVRGFQSGAYLVGAAGAGHVLQDNRFSDNRRFGMYVEGDGSTIQRNQVLDTGAVANAATGIHTAGSVDVLGNTVSGVISSFDTSAIGIQADANHGGSLNGNRVRGLVSDHAIFGIALIGSNRVTLRDNDIVGSGVGFGLACASAVDRARENVINGFATAIDTCGDAGGNDISP